MVKMVKQTFMGTADTLSGPSFWLIILGVTLVCFLSGPFGTLDILPAGFRIIYWGLMILSTGLLGLWFHTLIRVNDWHKPLTIVVLGVIFGLLVSAVIIIFGYALLSPIQKYPGAWELFSYSFPSATLIFISSVFLDNWQKAKPLPDEDQRPILFSKLKKYPNAKKIFSLHAQDHYVEVTTEFGSELCLMRLNDAISLVAPIEGVQIHRSSWVATSAIKEVSTVGANTQIELTNGDKLKVSQSRVKKLKAALQQP